jgi:serine/threonine protein kinase
MFDADDLSTLKMGDFGMACILPPNATLSSDHMDKKDIGTVEYDHFADHSVRMLPRSCVPLCGRRHDGIEIGALCADRYSAPEVLSAVAGVGHGKPSDMWSFGATLHVLLTGRNAFGRRPALSPADVRKNVLEGRRRVDIRAALKAQEYGVFVRLIDDCLHPQPDLLLRDLNLTSMTRSHESESVTNASRWSRAVPIIAGPLLFPSGASLWRTLGSL